MGSSYTQYDQFGNIITPEDLQNKTLWCKEGQKIEEAFVEKYGTQLQVAINPQKVVNPYVPDLVNQQGLADLKTQNTPFFKARKLYELNPSFAVVFNRKDYERYRDKYPNLDIYFWVEWHSVKFEMGSFVQEVEYVNGVWKIGFPELSQVISRSPEHFYKQRVNDTKGNAKSSFVLNILDREFIKVA
jgi:hypothetical protein